MAKKIYPGNWVTQLSSRQGQSVVAVPGRTYHHVVGFATITSVTGVTSWDVIIPSSDLRGDDKPRADITGLTVPIGANVYHVGIRVCDTRKDRGVGTATTSLTGTNTNRIKAASAIGDDGEITATKVATSSADLPIAATTIAPTGATYGEVTPTTLTSAVTLKVWSTNSTGTVAGAEITSSATGGTPVIVEVAYYTEDVCPDTDGTFIPFITEAGTE